MKHDGVRSVRTSVSFPADIYKNLEQLAMQKKVSLAWVVRDVVEKYVANKHRNSRSLYEFR